MRTTGTVAVAFGGGRSLATPASDDVNGHTKTPIHCQITMFCNIAR